MILQNKTLEKLRLLINEETEYRSGPQLVAFFNKLGFNDTYRQGFPSRWKYTDEKLNAINGTPELDKCIKNIFSPINFINEISKLDKHIAEFNNFLVYDDWNVIRNGKEISFRKETNIDFNDKTTEIKEDDFLKREFQDISIVKLGLDAIITEILELRFKEIEKCLSVNAPLSVIFLSGSLLEGILLGVASKFPKEFNTSKASPKNKDDKTKIKKFHLWTLNDFINVTHDIGFIKEDVKKFSHSLRDFRNYIHPYEQMSSRFNPDEHTAKICWQVLKTAIFQITNYKI